MTIQQLCHQIELNPGVAETVLSFAAHFDFNAVRPWLKAFRDQDRRKAARLELQKFLGEDDGNLKMLACMLTAAADLREYYREQGIGDDVYVDTMKCFSRFVEECYQRTGTYAFDRQWWTTRQAGGHLFRIGALEYELIREQDTCKISIHIPSDADFSREACDLSLARARAFFRQHFPQYVDCAYVCHSWLLAPELRELLEPDSNILNFQERFQITAEGTADLEFLEWVYNTYEKTFDTLPENTRLQKRLKQFLLEGRMLSDSVGILIPGK